MKSKKRIIIIAAIVVAVVLVLIFIPKGGGDVSTTLKSVTLKSSTLQNTISANGLVESVDSKNVYGTLTYPVETINVKVGDTVKAGDTLCLIDSENLLQLIAQKEASMKSSNINTYFQLSESEKKYNEAKNNLENGMNAELNSAEAALKSAEVELTNAKKKYNSSQETQTDTNNANLLKARSDLNDAKINYEASKAQYEEKIDKDIVSDKSAVRSAGVVFDKAREVLLAAKDELLTVQGKDEESVSAATNKVNDSQKVYDEELLNVYNSIKTNQLLDARKAVKSYEDIYDKANDAYKKLLREIGGDISQYAQVMDTAQINYDKAKKAYDSTELSINQQLESFKNTMEKDQQVIANDAQMVELANLQKNLSDCTVTAPIAGTVTAIYAKEGSVPSGVMFVIEDTESLKIKAKIKEYDIGDIAENMKVIIKSDATGDEEYEGYISKIAPTAIKQDAQTTGSSTSADVQFEVEITVKSQDTKLRIGMNTRLSIITKEKENVLGIRYDAIGKNKDDKDVLYIAKDNGNDIYTVEEVPVTIGLETDFEVEVTGEGLKEGTIVITDIDNIKAGSNVRLSK